MGLFSFLRKNKQEPVSDTGEFYSRAEENTKPARGRRSRTDSNADATLPERKRARRRLIGALALVLATIIGLPMILDSEPQPVGSDIAIEIPSKEKSELPSVHRMTPPAYPTPGIDAQEQSPQSAPASVEAQPAPATVTAPATAGAAAASKAASSAKEKAPLAKQPPAVSKLSNKAASMPPVKTSDEARALALLEGKSGDKAGADKSASAKAGESFVIQVAALSGKAKVAELRARLKHAGIQSYTQSVATASGERTRVRVGPFGSREEADKMLRRLSKIGLKNGTIVPGGR